MSDDINKSNNDWADFWRYDVGVNVIPANGIIKKPKVAWQDNEKIKKYLQEKNINVDLTIGGWQNNTIPKELHELWKKEGLFNDGMAVICGRVWFKHVTDELWLNMIDLDNKKAITEFCAGSLDVFSDDTIVECHSNNNKAHVYFYSRTPILPKPSDVIQKEKIDTNEIPGIEIKSCGRFLSYCTPSPHKDGSKIRILGKTIVATVNHLAIQERIKRISEKYGLNYDTTSSSLYQKTNLPELFKNDKKIIAGHNRSLGELVTIDSFYARLYELNLPKSFYEMCGVWFNANYTTEPMSEKRVLDNVTQSLNWIDSKKVAESDEKYQLLQSGNRISGSLYSNLRWLCEFYITKNKIIDRKELTQKLSKWSKNYKKEDDDAVKPKDVINDVFEDYGIFEKIKNIIKEYAKLDEQILLSKTQVIETAEWLIVKYHIKRLALGGALIYFDGECHSFKTEAFVEQQVNKCLPLAKKGQATEVLDYVKRNSPIIDENIIEKHSHVKCLLNGMYDIQTGKFFDHTPEYIVVNKIPHNWDENASLGESEKILGEIIGNEQNLKVFFDFCSICLYPDIGIYFMIIFLGSGGTGKKQLGTFMSILFGDENTSGFHMHDITNDTTDQIECARKILNIDEDMSPHDISNVTVLLKWITRDPFSGRSIYSLPIKYRPLSRLMANTNHLFEISNEEHAKAMYDRVHIVELEKRFRKTDDEIVDIVKKCITDENYNGMITKILKNATKLYQNPKVQGLQSPQQVEDIWNKFGNHVRAFIKYRTKKTPGGFLSKFDVGDAWDDFVYSRGYSEEKRIKFYTKFEEILDQKTDRETGGNRDYGYRGIRLLSDDETRELEQGKL